jgi:hypothetical protein
MYIDYYVERILICFIESNSRIFVQEDGAWSIKGRFSHAALLQEELPWQEDGNGKVSVSLLAVRAPFLS